jgi:aspartyl-tRNA(Asn)/glutamyl-tRNA(Gln) amidotransferase subunit C
MKITREEVLHVAELARLSIDEASIDRFSDQISKILEYVDTLNRVDTSGVEPMSHAISLNNVFREDDAAAPMDRDKALSNAPDKEDGHFVVPKVVG